VARSIRIPESESRSRVEVVRVRLPTAMPLEVVREVVVIVTVLLTAVVPESVKGDGGVQVTPVGAVPMGEQVMVMVPLNPLTGVRTTVAVAEFPAATESVELLEPD
jgi:hypothetical protein